ncbi:MAG TPA: MoxR family ATPase, partial [Nitrospiria bacterium]
TRRALQPASDLKPVLNASEVLDLQNEVDRVRMDDSLVDYLLALARATRASEVLALGVSPRGAMALRKAAQAYALVDGRNFCVPDDIKRLAPLVFSHRVIINARPDHLGRRAGEAERILEDLVGRVPVPV